MFALRLEDIFVVWANFDLDLIMHVDPVMAVCFLLFRLLQIDSSVFSLRLNTVDSNTLSSHILMLNKIFRDTQKRKLKSCQSGKPTLCTSSGRSDLEEPGRLPSEKLTQRSGFVFYFLFCVSSKIHKDLKSM